MSNQISTIGFGSDANLLAGQALSTNDRIGNINLLVTVPTSLAGSSVSYGQTVSSGSLYLKVKVHDGVTAPSGYYDVAGPFQIVNGGNQIVPLVGINSKRIGFFGSGNVKANISVILNNASALAGQDITIVPGPRAGWGFQDASQVQAFQSPGYPTLPPTSS